MQRENIKLKLQKHQNLNCILKLKHTLIIIIIIIIIVVIMIIIIIIIIIITIIIIIMKFLLRKSKIQSLHKKGRI
jgi:hypothetical protein